MLAMLRTGVAVAGAAMILGACSSGGNSHGPSCALGGDCSPAQVCTGGVAGCVFNCQCLDGTWQTPCPADAPQSGSACTAAGATCGYVTRAVACSGSVDCNCQSGAWSCAPTCVTDASTNATDAGPE
jgi:hypothetical protein